MWVPRIIRNRRKRQADLTADIDSRIERADKAVVQAATQAQRSEAIAQRSAELSKANSIAAILAGSLRIENTVDDRHRKQ